jgi:YggT family protein
MFVAGNVLSALAMVIHYVLEIYIYVVVARALISWVNPDPWNPIVQFLVKATEPALAPIRRIVGTRLGFDLSAFVLILILIFLQRAIVPSLFQMAIVMDGHSSVEVP